MYFVDRCPLSLCNDEPPNYSNIRLDPYIIKCPASLYISTNKTRETGRLTHFGLSRKF